MKFFLRLLYRQFIAIIYCCSFNTILTGILIGLGERLILLPNIIIRILISLHQGAFLGNEIAPIYVLLLGAGVLFLSFKVVVEGKYNLLFQSMPPFIANTGRMIVLIMIIPLAICVETGVAYRLSVDWFDMPSQETSKFLSIHGGSFFGTSLGIFYLLIVSVVSIAILILNRKKPKILSEKIQQTLQQQFSQTKNNSFPKQTKNKVSPSNEAKPIAIAYTLIFLLGIVYYATSALYLAIAMAIAIVIFMMVIWYQKFFQGDRQQRRPSITIQEHEAESITMLRAIPDSILRLSQNGICLSYMPAKETTYFVLYGNIVDKHIDEFLAPEIARQFMASIQSALQTGSTNICYFPILANNEKRHYEARATPIGETEVLILVRDLTDFNYPLIDKKPFSSNQNAAIKLLPELELIHLLDIILSDTNGINCILLCLTLDAKAINIDARSIDDADPVLLDDELIFQIAAKINSILPSGLISLLDDNHLAVLLNDCKMENASILVNNLNRDLNELSAVWQNNSLAVKFNIALLEINSSLDAAAWINAAKIACQMAKQKVNFQTFG